MPRLSIHSHIETWQYRTPFRIAGHVFDTCPVLVVTLRDTTLTGRGEASGVYYLNDDPDHMPGVLHNIEAEIAAQPSRDDLRSLLPPGGARNALDCALWELEAHQAGCAVWQLAAVPRPIALRTTMTLGADSPAAMAAGAIALADARALKLKLTGETVADMERVRAVRAARPDAWIGVDANQGYEPDTLEGLIGTLVDCRICLLEQPFPRGREDWMDGLKLPIQTAADESCQDLEELETLPGRFDVVNIKLDKCGGLTEGLLMARRARALGLDIMVGNMVGTSLAMAPAFVLGQLCQIVDLDGPIFLTADRAETVSYRNGDIFCSATVWGGQCGTDNAP